MRHDLGEVKAVIDKARNEGAQSVRPAVMEYLRDRT